MGCVKIKKRASWPKILLVEDDINTRCGLSEILQDEGYEVVVAESGKQALEAFDDSCDLVLCDLKLWDISGLDVIRRLRSRKPKLISIIMTAYTTTESVNEARAIGVYDWLSKPLNIDEMLTLIRELGSDQKTTTRITTIQAAQGV